SVGRATIALAGPYPKLAGRTEFAGLTQTLSDHDYAAPGAVAANTPPVREAALERTRAPNLTHVAASIPAPVLVPVPVLAAELDDVVGAAAADDVVEVELLLPQPAMAATHTSGTAA